MNPDIFTYFIIWVNLVIYNKSSSHPIIMYAPLFVCFRPVRCFSAFNFYDFPIKGTVANVSTCVDLSMNRNDIRFGWKEAGNSGLIGRKMYLVSIWIWNINSSVNQVEKRVWLLILYPKTCFFVNSKKFYVTSKVYNFWPLNQIQSFISNFRLIFTLKRKSKYSHHFKHS